MKEISFRLREDLLQMYPDYGLTNNPMRYQLWHTVGYNLWRQFERNMRKTLRGRFL